MTLTQFRFNVDNDGIALLIWDMPGRSMNVITEEVMQELGQVIDTVSSDPRIKGCVITSGKDTFSGGADLLMIDSLGRAYSALAREQGPEPAMRFFFEESRKLSLLFRRLETCGKPFVAAINGLCLGGAFEMVLACHRRVAVASADCKVGLPEIKVGLFPGAGGTQRVARMMPTSDALQFMMRGEQVRVDRAWSMKLVDELVPPEQLITTAKAAISSGLSATKPWDAPHFQLPAGPVYSPQGMAVWPAANAIYRRETFDNYPAGRALLQSVYEGLQLPMDQALAVESRQFAHILRSPQAHAMIRSLFVSMQELNKGARRPADVPPSRLRTIGVVGAGFMGSGIAYVSALAGLNVVLLDTSLASAERGKDYAHQRLTDQIMKGRSTSAIRDGVLARITPTDSVDALSSCELVIEAVFEDRAVKEDILAKVDLVLHPQAILASNTSTLPITSLAEGTSRARAFIGIHFFSPVEKMMLVEVIRGKETGHEAVAVALDYVRMLRKTPIVVNDSRGFYTSRVVGTYLREGHLMLMEGVPPAMIENLGRMAGMPVGPLALNDEVALDLAWKILQATKSDLGSAAVDPRQEKLLHAMVVERGRLGRKNGQGFYDYPKDGPKRLWSGLSEVCGSAQPADAFDAEDLKQRLLMIQALETARVFEEGCLTDVREADVGSILGFGFAPWSGGTLSYIDMMGSSMFVDRCQRLERLYGDRFAPSPLLLDMAQGDEKFYQRFAPRNAG